LKKGHLNLKFLVTTLMKSKDPIVQVLVFIH